MRIAVLSDMHGARRPFERALEDARTLGFDMLVLLGDLFTYGVDPEACRDLATGALEDGAILIGGNHDQLYVDLAHGETSYLENRPKWLIESVQWTSERLGGIWPERLRWKDEYIIEDVLLAHANPFGFGDWTYLNSPDLLTSAAVSLANRGLRTGVFGHVHRPESFTENGINVYVVGSIGQPRNRKKFSPEWALLEMKQNAVDLKRQFVEFDPVEHCATIQATKELSEDTRNRLCQFFQ
jgi:predicted phosphodiesterase